MKTYTLSAQSKDAAERNEWFLKVNGRPMSYQDVLKSWGGQFVGCSQDGGERDNSGSSDAGILKQT